MNALFFPLHTHTRSHTHAITRVSSVLFQYIHVYFGGGPCDSFPWPVVAVCRCEFCASRAEDFAPRKSRRPNLSNGRKTQKSSRHRSKKFFCSVNRCVLCVCVSSVLNHVKRVFIENHRTIPRDLCVLFRSVYTQSVCWWLWEKQTTATRWEKYKHERHFVNAVQMVRMRGKSSMHTQSAVLLILDVIVHRPNPLIPLINLTQHKYTLTRPDSIGIVVKYLFKWSFRCVFEYNHCHLLSLTLAAKWLDILENGEHRKQYSTWWQTQYQLDDGTLNN